MSYVKLSDLPLPIVRYKQLEHGKGLPAPSYATNGSSGLDLYAATDDPVILRVQPRETVIVPTGLILAIPKGFEGQVRPRSGLAVKHGVTVLNAPGTIDADYRGEIKVLLVNHHHWKPFSFKRGDRIAQLVIAPVITVTLQLA